jgi:plasmid stabilization system protein ParE
MEYSIVWTTTAEADFDATIEYISTNQNHERAIDFVRLVYSKIDLIAKMPFIGIESQQIKTIRRILISKNYSLLYQVNKEQVLLIRILDNRSAFSF